MDYFAKIVGQDTAIDLLKSSINNNRINHAYLFLGHNGTGKMATALAFAKQVIGISDKDAHVFWQEGVHPDVMLIEIMEGKTRILREQIAKEMEPWLNFKPYRAKHKIVIIRDSHLLGDEAANALLKTLEEPPPYAVIILVADQESLLKTIISRCQMVRFFPIREDILANYLIDLDIESKLANEVAKLAQGNMALAHKFLADQNFLSKWQTARGMLVKLNTLDISQIFAVAAKLNEDYDVYINMFLIMLRDILVYRTSNSKELVIMPENIDLANDLAIRDVNKLPDTIKNINDLKGYYQRYVNSKLISNNIAIEIWHSFN